MLFAGPAWAVEVELWPETYFQFQQYRDVEKLKIDKSRFTQLLSMNLFESSDEPRHRFFSSFRLDFDIGKDLSPDMNQDPIAGRSFALLYAFYEFRRIGDVVDLTFGRQLLTDEFGFTPIDGLRLEIRRDWHVGFDLYAGTEVKGALGGRVEGFELPNSDVHEPDGVIGDDRITGVFGLTAFLDGFRDTDLRLQYRHRYSGETDGQDVGLVFRQHLFGIWEFYTVESFSILLERFSELRFGTGFDFKWIRFNIEHESRRPSYDGDSIFNFFQASNNKQVTARLYIAPDDRTHLNIGYGRQLNNNDFILFDSWGHDGNASHNGEMSASRLFGSDTDLRLSYRFTLGWGGDYHQMLFGVGSYVWLRRIRLQLDVMGTYFNQLTYHDIMLLNRNRGMSWGVVGQSEFRLHEDVSLLLRADVYSNQFIERQFALFSVLEVHSWL